jgi:multisubunit Na+/H+ antiporter MnhF subunit
MYWFTMLALLPPLAVGVIAARRGPLRTRPLAIPFVSMIVAILFVLMALAMQQPSYVDLALTLAVLGLPGTLAYAFFMERWL